MWLYFLLAFLSLAVCLYSKIVYHFGYWARKGIPHERPRLLIGNMAGVGKTLHISELLERTYAKFKGQSPIAGMFLFSRRVAVVLDLDLVKHILISNFKDFHDRGTYSNVRDDPLTGNLVHLEGAQWKAMREKLSSVFSVSKSRGMLPCIVKIGENLVRAYQAKVKDGQDNEVDVTEMNARYTTDVIGSCAFGLDCNSLQNPEAEFRAKGREFFAKPRLTRLTRAFVANNPRLARKLHIKAIPDHITDFFLDCVRQTIEYREKNQVKRDDLMDIMISLKAKDSLSPLDQEKGIDLSQGLTLEQITAQVFVFFIAGFNSSSLTLSYCLYELVKSPDIQERLREEILDFLAEHNNEITFQMIQEMPYLDQVLAETLRLYPIIGTVLRRADKDFLIPNTTTVIEKGVTVLIPTVAIQRDASIYPEPKRFLPERFTKENAALRHHYSYLPFGEGPRKCIGLLNAQMQIKVALISLLSNFRFSKSPKTVEEIEVSKTGPDLLPKTPIYLRVERLYK